MTANNIERFNIQVLRAIAFLYKNFPDTVTIEHSTLHKSAEALDGAVTVYPEGGGEHGTILWLYKNGIVTGDLIESNPLEGNQTAAITDAQLSASAMRTLQARGPGVGSFGEFAVSVASASGEREAGYAELVVRRLLGA